jgi:lipopolysaccharide export LptBFGC system permease protein LptF
MKEHITFHETDRSPEPKEKNSEARRVPRFRYSLAAIFAPLAIIALSLFVARRIPGKESDWMGGRFLVLALIGMVFAVVSSIGFTIAAVKRGETLYGAAIVSCAFWIIVCILEL